MMQRWPISSMAGLCDGMCTTRWPEHLSTNEGVARSIPRNEERIAQAWVKLRRGMWVFAEYFWHSEGWTPKNEALINGVVNQARTTRHLWLMACDANMTPKTSGRACVSKISAWKRSARKSENHFPTQESKKSEAIVTTSAKRYQK